MQGTANKYAEGESSLPLFQDWLTPFARRNRPRGDVTKPRASQGRITGQGEDIQLLELHAVGCGE